ncbi:Os06g0327400 [Oryza sativa Japonica Group]|uniref:Os06g0327400 protein n=1 Tax=Oryza sativa subsp. japonica TaxID=39947 RepID=A0A0P0WWH2_ORYSJ|nr:hypothetical protein EE612_033789 [Oryza sativa]BAS97538.1 Os06g0327400 [Oryza sativa Japonica Group]
MGDQEMKYYSSSSYARLGRRWWRRPAAARGFRLIPTRRLSVRRLRARLWTLLGILGRCVRSVRLLTRGLVVPSGGGGSTTWSRRRVVVGSCTRTARRAAGTTRRRRGGRRACGPTRSTRAPSRSASSSSRAATATPAAAAAPRRREITASSEDGLLRTGHTRLSCLSGHMRPCVHACICTVRCHHVFLSVHVLFVQFSIRHD